VMLDGEEIDLDRVEGVYLRLTTAPMVPKVVEPPAERGQSTGDLLSALLAWCEVAPARVLNRPSAMAVNVSKPYLAQRVATLGLDVPETLVSSDSGAVAAFTRTQPGSVRRSCNGQRIPSHQPPVHACPVLHQAPVEGVNVRVHVVGARCFATAGRPSEPARFELPDDVAERCVALSRGLDLELAAIDLCLRPDGVPTVLDVDPCPDFHRCEAPAGLPVARAIAAHLAAG